MKLKTLKTETHLYQIPLTIWILAVADIHPINIKIIIIIFNIYHILFFFEEDKIEYVNNTKNLP